MISKKFTKFMLFILASITLLTGCSTKQLANSEEKELLIYCGITMIAPMSEIAEIIEAQENCKVIITKGGSGNLLDSIRTNKVGDLYLPGSDSYIETCLTEGIVSETAFVGYNKAAIFVQKGNPKNITADLDNMTNKDYYVVIGNPESGSIGSETQKILEKKGIYAEVQLNAREMTTDSKRLITVLKDKEADLVINWFATSVWDENSEYVDVLPIDEKYATKNKLVIGLLKTSNYPDIAKKFIEYASSEEGEKIFDKYGLYNVE
jgi:molybdate transport system substrate-binding protein